VEDSILDIYKKWLKEHVIEILDLPGFKKAQIFREDKKFVVHYYLKSRKDLDNYLENHAPLMRQKGIDLFKDKFKASRRFLYLEEEL
jgi:hypothetical protein